MKKCDDVPNDHQAIMITEKGEIIINDQCIAGKDIHKPLELVNCVHHWMDEPKSNQTFVYDKNVTLTVFYSNLKEILIILTCSRLKYLSMQTEKTA